MANKYTKVAAKQGPVVAGAPVRREMTGPNEFPNNTPMVSNVMSQMMARQATKMAIKKIRKNQKGK